MTDSERLLKNNKISQTKRETISRHENMNCHTYTFKIQENSLNNQQKEFLKMIFIEQKWLKNYILNWCEQDKENKLTKFDTKITKITHKDKDMNDVKVELKYLSAQSKQCLISRMYSNIKTLHTLKSKGLQKCGKLKYSKEEKVIDLKQYGTSHKIISKNRFKISGCKKSFKVNGINQFINIPNIEYANARLLNRADGYYVQLVCYIPKENKIKNEKINKVIGIDFGCSTSFTTSEGEKINISIQESERLKLLQKKFARQVKGSKNWYKTLELIKKEYQKQTNRKDDISNKIVHKFSQYKTVVIQNEQLKNWSKNHHGKAIQHSVLGRVKSKLKTKENVVILSKTVPTTKLCTNCGVYHDELKVWDRTFKCECGVEMDRDVHASKNMVWFYENNVGVERTNIKRVEMEALVLGVIRNSKNQLVLKKHEAYSL